MQQRSLQDGMSLDARGVASVALRIWGLLLLLGAAVALPGTIVAARAALAPQEQADFIRASQTASMLSLGATATLGLCLLLWADSIARLVIPETVHIQVGLDASQLLTVGLALVGVVTLIHGLEDAAWLAYVLSAIRPPGGIMRHRRTEIAFDLRQRKHR